MKENYQIKTISQKEPNSSVNIELMPPSSTNERAELLSTNLASISRFIYY